MFEEFIVVLEHSKKTQLALILGAVFFFGILLVGNYLTSQLVLEGFLAPLTETIRDSLMNRYDKAAWAALAAFGIQAFKCYRKDKKRLFGT